ncbi:MAE_28990/MAE_18760 family HEPN-like nuclease [Bacillus cereus]|uniref:MAE_28990/MAE_18760 family HEPN-like nuclease n=1 Tax=Bacillus cereus TaxID=1396 RepID=UPI00397F9CED
MATCTLETLQDKLDRNLSWRKKELTLIKSNIMSANGEMLLTALRSGVTLLYAHWEGYIKLASREYLKYLNAQNLKCCTIIDNLFILYLKKTVKDAKQSNKSLVHAQIYNKILYDNENIFQVDVMDKDIVSTESNLSYDVLRDILFSLGFDEKDYELKRHFIENHLLNKRNQIAHGEYVSFVRKQPDADQRAKEEFNQLYREILRLIEKFKEQILDAAVYEKYKKSS